MFGKNSSIGMHPLNFIPFQRNASVKALRLVLKNDDCECVNERNFEEKNNFPHTI